MRGDAPRTPRRSGGQNRPAFGQMAQPKGVVAAVLEITAPKFYWLLAASVLALFVVVVYTLPHRGGASDNTAFDDVVRAAPSFSTHMKVVFLAALTLATYMTIHCWLYWWAHVAIPDRGPP